MGIEKMEPGNDSFGRGIPGIRVSGYPGTQNSLNYYQWENIKWIMSWEWIHQIEMHFRYFLVNATKRLKMNFQIGRLCTLSTIFAYVHDALPLQWNKCQIYAALHGEKDIE